jgi:hypothetical protein
MKHPLYYCFLLLVCTTAYSQNPGGVTGSVLWLKANTNASSAAWNDNSAQGNNLVQASVPDQPTLATNLFNFNPGFQFDGISSHFSNLAPVNFPTGSTSRTIFAVANSNSTSGYHWLFTYGNPGTINGTCQLGSGNVNAVLTNAYFGSSSDMSTTASFWDNSLNANGALVCFTMADGTLTQTLRDRGIDLISLTPYRGDLSAPSANAFLGRLGPPFGEYWDGSMAEVIMFNTDLSAVNRNQVESYLALKYGFTLGSITTPISYTASDGSTVFWTGSAVYQNEVFGIGTDNGSSLTQTQSNSSSTGDGGGVGQIAKGNITLSVATALADNQFLMIGNDAGAFTESVIAAGQAPPIAVGAKRVARNWRVQNTGSVGNVDLGFDITGFSFGGGNTLSEYRLMIDNDGDGDYTTGTQTFIAPSSLNGSVFNFTGITLPNNAVFTIITQAAGSTLPATWKEFNVQLRGNRALLNWKTTDEFNADFYSVEHAADGVGFREIGTTAAKNTPGIHSYSFTHENLAPGNHFYRIKLVDKDGKYQYSITQSVGIAGNTRVSLRTNPVHSNRFELLVNVVQPAAITLRILTPDGKIVKTVTNRLTAGSTIVTTDITGLAAGIYLVEATVDKQVYTSRLVRL